MLPNYSNNSIFIFLLIFWHNYFISHGFVTTTILPKVQPIQPILVSSPPPSTPPSPTMLPICGSNLPSDTINGYSKAHSNSPYLRLRYQPSHIGVLPQPGQSAKLILTENGTIPTPSIPTTTPFSPDNDEMVKTIDYPTEDSALIPIFCSIKLEACSSCAIEIEFEPPSWHFSEYEIDQISKCDEPNMLDKACFDIEIIEERAEQSIPYLATLSGVSDVYSRTSIWSIPNRRKIRSSGNSVLIVVALRNIESNLQLLNYLNTLFPMNVVVYDNTEIVYGQPSDLLANRSSIGFVESPRYPEAYPRSIVKNYTIINEKKAGFIRLTFDDFHVHFQSELKIIDSDGTELFNTRSEYRRPPALLSRSNKLTIIFMGHDFTQVVGFRARYEFVENLNWPDKPSRRNCDDFLEGYGGQISLDSQKTLLNKNIDCIWLIGRFPALSRTFDKIYLKVQEFQLKGVGLRLEVRRGPSSTAERVLMLFDEQLPTQLERKQPLEGLITEDHLQPAFYVRLRGYLTINTGLSIVYTQFYRWATALCPGGDGEFHCDNSKCIKSSLQCDGYDHCGDASDEVCHLPDIQYEPPKIDVAGILTLVIGAAGIIVLMLTMLAILSKLYRHGYFGRRRNRGAADGTSGGGGIATTSASAMAQEAFCNELAPTIQTIGERRFYILPENQLNIIEAPPTYDTALKHPRVPDNGNHDRQANRRSRSAMAYVYTNEGYHRSPDESNPALLPPPFEADQPTSSLSPCQQRLHKRISSPQPPIIASSRSHSNPPHVSSHPQHSSPPPYPSTSPPPPTRTPTPLPSHDPISSSPTSPIPPSSSRSQHQDQTVFLANPAASDSSRPDTSRSARSGDDESWV